MEAKFDRSQGIGGSDAARLYEGNWHQLWSEKIGETSPVDLSGVLPVQMGIHTESFNIDWFIKNSGYTVKHQQELIYHTKYKYIYAHVDGLVQEKKDNYSSTIGILECKHTNAFNNPIKVTNKYMPQIQHYLMVTDLDKAYLSVFFGNMKYEIIEVEKNIDFQRKLIAAEVLFWYYVRTKQIPPETITWDTFQDIKIKETIPSD